MSSKTLIPVLALLFYHFRNIEERQELHHQRRLPNDLTFPKLKSIKVDLSYSSSIKHSS